MLNRMFTPIFNDNSRRNLRSDRRADDQRKPATYSATALISRSVNRVAIVVICALLRRTPPCRIPTNCASV